MRIRGEKIDVYRLQFQINVCFCLGFFLAARRRPPPLCLGSASGACCPRAPQAACALRRVQRPQSIDPANPHARFLSLIRAFC